MKQFLLLILFVLSTQVGAYSEEDLEKLRASLSYANLSGADLTEANLSRANLFDANLREANVKGATFCNTTMPDGTINNSGC